MGKTEDQILELLSNSEPLTLVEIAEKLGKKPKGCVSFVAETL